MYIKPCKKRVTNNGIFNREAIVIKKRNVTKKKSYCRVQTRIVASNEQVYEEISHRTNRIACEQ